MLHSDNRLLPEECRIIEFPHVSDERGTLTFGEGNGEIPFVVNRLFWIYDVPAGVKRGGHAHWTCSEVVVPVKGAFTMVVDDGSHRTEVRLDSPCRGILIPAGVWCELKDFEPDTTLVVAASAPYDAQGYVHDYEKYKNVRQK